jgi:hypothetical protein
VFDILRLYAHRIRRLRAAAKRDVRRA